jgi:hypothetical protein
LRAIEAIVAHGALAAGAELVLEHSTKQAGEAANGPEIAGLVWGDTRRYGDTSLSFYEWPGR